MSDDQRAALIERIVLLKQEQTAIQKRGADIMAAINELQDELERLDETNPPKSSWSPHAAEMQRLMSGALGLR